MRRILSLVVTIAVLASLIVPQSSIAASKKLFQAEKGKVNKPAVVNKKFKGASGKGSVLLKGKNPSVDIKVKLPKATTYTTTVRYSKKGKPASKINVLVNGKRKGRITLKATKGWNKWKTHVFEVSIPKGKSTVTLKKANKKGKVAIDYISFTKAPKKKAVDINFYKKFQKIEGFGSFGAKYNWWERPRDGKFVDDEFTDLMVNNMGLTVSRLNIHSDFEEVNDNNDPYVTDLTKYNVGGIFKNDIEYVKSFYNAGVKKFIATVWSPPAWMKTNNDVENGGELKPECYEEFAEMLVAYIKIFKQEMGFDLWAISLQNELAFVEPYESCVYTPEQMAELLNVVGKRFKKEKIKIKIFGPEDMLGSLNKSIRYILAMEENGSLKYLDAVAWHGYSDGVSANSAAPNLWNSSYIITKDYGKQHWMTETSGYNHEWVNTVEKGDEGEDIQVPSAFIAAKDIFIALKHGKINLWTWWGSSDPTFSRFALTKRGEPSKKVWISKQFFRYIRPGAVHVASSSKDKDVKVVAFEHKKQKTFTIVLLNLGKTEKTVNISVRGGNLPKEFQLYRTSATEDCKDLGTVNRKVTLPAECITTLFGSY